MGNILEEIKKGIAWVLGQSPTGTFQSQTTLPLSLMRIVILCLSDGPKFT